MTKHVLSLVRMRELLQALKKYSLKSENKSSSLHSEASINISKS